MKLTHILSKQCVWSIILNLILFSSLILYFKSTNYIHNFPNVFLSLFAFLWSFLIYFLFINKIYFPWSVGQILSYLVGRTILINFMEFNRSLSKVVSFSHFFSFMKYFFLIQIIYYSFRRSSLHYYFFYNILWLFTKKKMKKKFSKYSYEIILAWLVLVVVFY